MSTKMIVTAELSLYPLSNEYESPIIELIQSLKKYPGLMVYTNAMSTQIKGEYGDVMKALSEHVYPAFQNPNSVCLVVKLLNRNLPIESGHLNFDTVN